MAALGSTPAPISPAQLVQRLLAADGQGSRIEADLVLARRPRKGGHNGFPRPSAGATITDQQGVIALANFGA